MVDAAQGFRADVSSGDSAASVKRSQDLSSEFLTAIHDNPALDLDGRNGGSGGSNGLSILGLKDGTSQTAEQMLFGAGVPQDGGFTQFQDLVDQRTGAIGSATSGSTGAGPNGSMTHQRFPMENLFGPEGSSPSPSDPRAPGNGSYGAPPGNDALQNARDIHIMTTLNGPMPEMYQNLEPPSPEKGFHLDRPDPLLTDLGYKPATESEKRDPYSRAGPDTPAPPSGGKAPFRPDRSNTQLLETLGYKPATESEKRDPYSRAGPDTPPPPSGGKAPFRPDRSNTQLLETLGHKPATDGEKRDPYSRAGPD